MTDTVYKTEYVYVYSGTTDTVHDTVRETVIVYLDADGDTTRKDTEREHVTDRTRQQKSVSGREATQLENHEREESSDRKETVVEQPKQNPIAPYLWGALVGIVLTTAVIIFVRLRKR